MQTINDHVDAHILPGTDDAATTAAGAGGPHAHPAQKPGTGHGGSTVPEINGLHAKIDKLEGAEKKLKSTFEALRSDLDSLSRKLIQMAVSLLDLFREYRY